MADTVTRTATQKIRWSTLLWLWERLVFRLLCNVLEKEEQSFKLIIENKKWKYGTDIIVCTQLYYFNVFILEEEES